MGDLVGIQGDGHFIVLPAADQLVGGAVLVLEVQGYLDAGGRLAVQPVDAALPPVGSPGDGKGDGIGDGGLAHMVAPQDVGDLPEVEGHRAGKALEAADLQALDLKGGDLVHSRSFPAGGTTENRCPSPDDSYEKPIKIR